jgi:hypothetical protein
MSLSAQGLALKDYQFDIERPAEMMRNGLINVEGSSFSVPFFNKAQAQASTP